MAEPQLVTKVLVPWVPTVIAWWASPNGAEEVRLMPCTDGEPHVHLQVWGPSQFELDGSTVDGVHAVIQLPQDAVLGDCHVDWVHVMADFHPYAGMGVIRALHLACPVSSDGRSRWRWRHRVSGWFSRLLITWLLLPWPILLTPLALWSLVRPTLIVVARHFRRQRRIWRLRVLTKRAHRVAGAFGQGEPCCICLAETSQENSIALLPCKHALHGECYCEWICKDSYPSHDLLCPLCRRRAVAVGVLSQ